MGLKHNTTFFIEELNTTYQTTIILRHTIHSFNDFHIFLWYQLVIWTKTYLVYIQELKPKHNLIGIKTQNEDNYRAK